VSDPFRVGEIAELCNMPAELAQFNGTEVAILELAAHREWRMGNGKKTSGVAYIVFFQDAPTACRPEHLRKKPPPIDTVDTEAPNKKTRWSEGPWQPKETSRA